jgi:hypothetical protein
MFWCWGCWLCHLLMTRRRLWSARAMICKVLSNKCFQIKEKGLLVTLPLEKELFRNNYILFRNNPKSRNFTLGILSICDICCIRFLIYSCNGTN